MQQSYFEKPDASKTDRNTEFSGLLVIQKDMKDIFRKLMRQEIRFKHHLQQAHTRFFQKFFKQKRAMFIEESAPIAGGTLGPRTQPGSKVNEKGELI